MRDRRPGLGVRPGLADNLVVVLPHDQPECAALAARLLEIMGSGTV